MSDDLADVLKRDRSVVAKFYQWRFPKSKKIRIREKWSKDQRNWRFVPYPGVKLRDGTFVISREFAEGRAQVITDRLERRILNSIM